MQLPEYFKRHDSSGETLVQPMGNSRLQKCFISIQSFVYIDMIRLFPVKVRVKKSSDVNWIWQAKNTELTCICAICWLCTLSVFIFCKSSPCKRKTHCVNEWKKVVRVCVCARAHIHWHDLLKEHSSSSQYFFYTKRWVLQKKLWIQRAAFWKWTGQSVRKLDKIMLKIQKFQSCSYLLA